MSDVRLHTPRGVRDLLPYRARQKSAIEHRLAQHFSKWGYDPVVTPTLEFMDVLRMAQTAPAGEQLYRFVDREGSVLALRPEMTVPIARLVASRLKDEPTPLRLQYTGSVFRYDEPHSGRLREFTQAGIELIGPPGPVADAEVIATTIEAMMDMGLTGFRMDLGHVAFASGVIDSLDLGTKATDAIRRTLLHQDYVGMERVLQECGAGAHAKESLHTLVGLRGDASMLQEAQALAKSDVTERALENIAAVYDSLDQHGVAGWIRVDLGMLKQSDYYTGVVVEGYTADMGYALCSGGRYDNLLERFGYDVPATGLAIGVERLLLALDRSGVPNGAEPQRLLLVSVPSRRSEACSAAWRLRQQGFVVEMDVLGLGPAHAVAYANERQIPRVVLFDEAADGTVEVIDGGRHVRVAADELLDSGGPVE